MRAALHLLVLACLLWCALGIAEPAQAHVELGEVAAAQVDQTNWPFDHASGEQAAGDHHHCPVAPHVPLASAPAQPVQHRTPVFAESFVALESLTRAPPLQPPALA